MDKSGAPLMSGAESLAERCTNQLFFFFRCDGPSYSKNSMTFTGGQKYGQNGSKLVVLSPRWPGWKQQDALQVLARGQVCQRQGGNGLGIVFFFFFFRLFFWGIHGSVHFPCYLQRNGII